MKGLMRVVGFIWLLAGIAGFFIYLCHQHWNWTWDWNMLGVFATWVLAGGIFFVFWQIMEARRSTGAQVAVELFRELRSEDTPKILYEIYQREHNDWKRLLTSSEEDDIALKDKIESVLAKLELIGALVAQGIIDKRIAIEAYSGSTVLRCWYILREYIEKSRDQRGGLFCKYLEDFAARTWEYQKRKRRHYKDEWIKYQRREEEPINLIEYFDKNTELRPKRCK